ncbi:MAG: SulP family inorganic anion transporter, partial [Caldilineaceae bacterium]
IPIDSKRVPLDIVAGITLAALAIPEVMGYSKIAGMPVVTGLYTILIPTALFALFGSSRHLVVGADSATAAIMAAGLVGLATVASPEYVAYAGILALLAAAFLIIARVLKLGFLADFLSRTVLIGFLTGVGVQVAIGQISGMLGIPGGGSGPIQNLITDVQQLGQVNVWTLGVSIGVLAIIVGGRMISKSIPGPLIAVIGMIVASYFFDFAAHGVSVLGTVPGGLPKFGLPTGATLNQSILGQLIAVAVSMFVVILAQSAATSRAYATRYNETFSENTDLIGLGLANIGAGLTGTFVVNGSPTKTQMVDSAGGHSQLSMLTTSGIVLIVLLFLTKPLAYMPNAVLSAVVFLIGVELVDIKGMRKILAQRPVEFWVALITAAVVIFVGVEQGILLAMVLSILVHTRHGYKPKNSLLKTDEDGKFKAAPISSHAKVLPGLLVYRFNHSMYYANAEFFTQEVLDQVNQADPPLSWLCIDATAVDEVDFSAGATLIEMAQLLKERKVKLVLSQVEDDVRTELDRSGVTDAIGSDAFFDTIEDVIEAYREAYPDS